MRSQRLLPAATLLLVALALPARGGDHPPYAAAAGLDLARSAAASWQGDARLVYVENDEDVDASGRSVRWGYLFYSEQLDAARGYTIRDGKILEATELEFELEDPPPLATRWIDSDAALKAAEEKAGREYRLEHGGTLNTMLLVRGAFYHKEPDLSTWTLLYTSATAPALWVVVSAENGKVLRTWRG